MAELVLSAKELGVRSLPAGSPVHLEHILDELNESLDLDAPGTSLRLLKKAFGFLSSYFADLIEGVVSGLTTFESSFMERGDTLEAMQTIRRGVELLQSGGYHERPEVKALLDCFFDSTGGGRQFARLMGIGGRPKRGSPALMEKFIPAPVPVRKKCVQEIRIYIPVLREWLEASASFFSHAAIVSERTSLAARQTIKVQLGQTELVAGKRIDIADCPLCIPHKEILIPTSLYEHPVTIFVPQKPPAHLAEILDRLDKAMKKEKAVPGCLELRNALEFLIRYSAGVASKLCEDLGALPKSADIFIDSSQSLPASEKLLNLSLDALKRIPDSQAAKVFISIFYRRNEHFEFVPRWHTEILALHGQLSAWCQLDPGQGELTDPEVCKLEFEKHVPTLREWLMAMSGYLQVTEHFFNEVKPEGCVEFSVRLGDRFVEVGEPGYVLWLNNPRPEGEDVVETEAGTATKPLIRESIAVPLGCPEVLKRILTRMDIYLRLGDPIESCVSLRDALDYMTRYFAGVAVAAFRQLGTLPPEAEQLAQQSLSIHDCEKLLILALGSIGHRGTSERLGLAVRSVFYYTEDFSGTEKPTGSHSRLLALDADPNTKMQNLAEFCSLQTGEGVLSHPARSKRELERFLPTLQDWLAMAELFFKECEHQEEPPEEDGLTELIIQFQDYDLELVAPDYTFYIRPGADTVPDIEAPELPPPDLVFDDDLVDAPARKKSPEEAARDKPFLVHRVELIGDRPNSKGKKCAAGFIVLTNAGGGTLSGNASTTEDCIEVDPARFRGNKVQLSYWVDTESLPKTYEAFILLKTSQEERSISVYEMIGQKSARRISPGMGTLLMLMPVVFWLGLMVAAFHGISHFMNEILTNIIGPGYKSLRLVRDAPDAYSAVIFLAQVMGVLYMWVAGCIPMLVARAYRAMPPSTQELLVKRRVQIMVLPSVLVAILMFTPVLKNYFSSAPDFPVMSPYGLYLYFLGLNLGSMYYQEASLTERLDDVFTSPFTRRAVRYAAWFVFITVIFLGLSM
jgi:hypothetical protein